GQVVARLDVDQVALDQVPAVAADVEHAAFDVGFHQARQRRSPHLADLRARQQRAQGGAHLRFGIGGNGGRRRRGPVGGGRGGGPLRRLGGAGGQAGAQGEGKDQAAVHSGNPGGLRLGTAARDGSS